MCSGRGFDQLRRDAHPVTRLAHASLQHIAHAEFPPDLPHIDGPAFVGEARIARDHEQPFDPRQAGDDVLDHAVGDILLLAIAAHVLERQDRDRRPVGQRKASRGLFGRGGFTRRGGLDASGDADLQRINPDGMCDVLELDLAKIGHGEIEPGPDLAIGVFGETDRARLGDTFQSGGDVDAVSQEVAVALLDHVPEMNADAKLDATLWRQAGIAVHHDVLHLNGATHGVDHAAELNQGAIAHPFDDASAMRSGCRIDQVAPQAPQSGQGAILVRADQPTISDDVSNKDRSDFPGLTHVVLPSSWRLAHPNRSF
jgi:hypothetical protein